LEKAQCPDKNVLTMRIPEEKKYYETVIVFRYYPLPTEIHSPIKKRKQW